MIKMVGQHIATHHGLL